MSANMETAFQIFCPKCKAEVSAEAYFCPNCGTALRSRQADTSVPKQILIYFVSFFLAPFGLGYAFSYLKQADRKSKMIGAVSLILTIASILAVIFLAKVFLQQEYSAINAISGGTGGF